MFIIAAIVLALVYLLAALADRKFKGSRRRKG